MGSLRRTPGKLSINDGLGSGRLEGNPNLVCSDYAQAEEVIGDCRDLLVGIVGQSAYRTRQPNL